MTGCGFGNGHWLVLPQTQMFVQAVLPYHCGDDNWPADEQIVVSEHSSALGRARQRFHSYANRHIVHTEYYRHKQIAGQSHLIAPSMHLSCAADRADDNRAREPALTR